MKNMFKQTTMAMAVAAASFGAFAGDLDRTSGTQVGGESAIVMANEVFGTGSEETLVAIPDVTFTVDLTKDSILDGETATVKFTLDSGAVFGEDLSDIDKWAASGSTLVFTLDELTAANIVLNVGGTGSPYAQDAKMTVNVTSGGAIGDNTVTFELVDTASAGNLDNDIQTIDVAGFKVKNLTSALKRGVTGVVKLGAEFRNVTTQITDTDTALEILKSQDGVELTGAATKYDENGASILTERARIDVADTELSFTGDQDGQIGSDAAQDFDETDNVSYVQLGNLEVKRTQYLPAAGVATNVKKEDANDFDFNGSDTLTVNVTSTSSLEAYSSVYLRSTGTLCTATATGADFAGVVSADKMSVAVNLTGESTADLSAGYNVCAVAGGTVTIPETTFAADLDVAYFNPRYTNSADNIGFESLLRNGCQVTLFNVPNSLAGDKAYIRLTNVSEKPGAVRGFIWGQDGTQMDLNSELLSSLAAHATTVLSTDTAHSGYIGTAMAEYAAVTSGRHRIVLQGAFPACEALGLIRTPSGVLTNMTSTTYSGDASRLGAQNNGTSNTSN